MTNPTGDALKASAAQVRAVLGWHVIGSDGVQDITDREDIADQWRSDGLTVTPLAVLSPPVEQAPQPVEDNEKLREACRKAEVCMTCVLGAPDTYGCTDCLNTGWDGGAPPNSPEDIRRLFTGMIDDFTRLKDRSKAPPVEQAPQPVAGEMHVAASPITVDEVEGIILRTEPPGLSDRDDQIWTRRMATGLANLFNKRLAEALSDAPTPTEAPPAEQSQAAEPWRSLVIEFLRANDEGSSKLKPHPADEGSET